MNQALVRNCTAGFAALALAASAETALGQDIERSFSVNAGDTVRVDVERARISVETWDRNEVAFSAVEADRLEFEFEQEDGVVTIRGREPDGRLSWGWLGLVGNTNAEIMLNVPYLQDLNLRTSGGDVELDRLQGEFRARTSGGDIEAGEVDGTVDVETSGGTIRLEQASGSVAAKTSGGRIRLGNMAGTVDARTSGGSIRIAETGAGVEARTSGGSIEIDHAGGAVNARTSGGSVTVGFARQPEAGSELRTSGGGVTAYLPGDFRADISAQTSGGRIHSDFPEASADERGRELEHALNGGGPELILKTSGGSIRIHRRESQVSSD